MISVKICGLKNINDLDVSIRNGASFGGFVFYEKSIRNLRIDEATILAKYARDKLSIVALFVNAEENFIEEVVSKIKPDFIQLHGSETIEMCEYIYRKFGIPIIKAIQISSIDDFETARMFSGKVNKILFDTKLNIKKLSGISKATIDWDIFKNLDINNEWMLAGGLNVYNIRNAIFKTHAKSIDISGGVEISPGEKSPNLIKNFLHKVKIISHETKNYEH